MDKRFTLPLAAALGGAAAFVLRLLQVQTGFEADSGLPIPGNLAGWALAVFFVGMAAVFWLLGLGLPKEDPEAPSEFPFDFASDNTGLLSLTMGGIALLMLSALADLAEAVGALPDAFRVYSRHSLYAILRTGNMGFDPRGEILSGVLLLAACAGLFLAVAACRKHREARPLSSWVLLPPSAVLVVRLVYVYRIDSVNPSLAMYYPGLLALIFMILAFYRLSSFGFQAGNTRRFSLYACLTLLFSCAALADGNAYLSSLLVYAGGSATLMGFLLLRLATQPGPEPDSDGTIIGPAE